jgi:hypothetical protein
MPVGRRWSGLRRKRERIRRQFRPPERAIRQKRARLRRGSVPFRDSAGAVRRGHPLPPNPPESGADSRAHPLCQAACESRVVRPCVWVSPMDWVGRELSVAAGSGAVTSAVLIAPVHCGSGDTICCWALGMGERFLGDGRVGQRGAANTADGDNCVDCNQLRVRVLPCARGQLTSAGAVQSEPVSAPRTRSPTGVRAVERAHESAGNITRDSPLIVVSHE